MYVYVQALDYNRLLRIQVEPNELVRSLKSKIDYELGGNIPEDIIDSINYLGVTLDCSTPLSHYGIRDSSFLYMGRQLQYQQQTSNQTPPPVPQTQVQPQLAPQPVPAVQTGAPVSVQQPQVVHTTPQPAQSYPQYQYPAQYPAQYQAQYQPQYQPVYQQQYQYPYMTPQNPQTSQLVAPRQW